jgi:hypothetical protein
MMAVSVVSLVVTSEGGMTSQAMATRMTQASHTHCERAGGTTATCTDEGMI